MNFLEWIFWESLLAQDSENIVFQADSLGYQTEFKENGIPYKVQFKNVQIIQLSDLGPCFTIDFYGPNGLNLAKSGNPFRIYSRVLRVIKKFIETYRPAGIKFSGHNPNMDLLYQKFYEKYLAQSYTRLNITTYARNDLIGQLDTPNNPSITQHLDSIRQNKLAANKLKINRYQNTIRSRQTGDPDI